MKFLAWIIRLLKKPILTPINPPIIDTVIEESEEVEVIIENNLIQNKLEKMYNDSFYSVLPKQVSGKVKLSQKTVENAVIGILENKELYLKSSELVKEKTGYNVPWEIIGVLHYREGGLRAGYQILNGQSWKRKTTWVPRGFGPWKSFEESCVTAFQRKPYRAKTIGQTLDFLERWNGLGYRNKNINSPYIWSLTNQYNGAYYTSDGVFDRNAVNLQSGCAIILKALNFKNQ